MSGSRMKNKNGLLKTACPSSGANHPLRSHRLNCLSLRVWISFFMPSNPSKKSSLINTFLKT